MRFLMLAAFLESFSVFAQRGAPVPTPRVGSSVVDDSTRAVYGPKTTLWTTEEDLFENRNYYRPLDTATSNYHRWTYVQRFNNLCKDLGVVGTALSSIFPQMPAIIGASPGFQVYEPYYTTQEPHYFDTKSPFTRMHVIWGGRGRAMTGVEFSRNITPRWNFGFNYRPILVEKQLQSQGSNDLQVTSHYYDFYTTFKSKNERYFLLFNFRRIRHRVNETGGVALKEGDPDSELFDENAKPYLVAAKTEEYRRNIHLFQQYQLAKALQIYHAADFFKQTNGFSDDRSQDPNSLFDAVVIDSALANDQTTFISMQQEGGIKGNASKLFYSAYYKFRMFDFSNPHLDGIYTGIETSGVENYLGGQLALRFDSLSEVSGSAEYLFGGYFRVEGRIQTPWIEGYFKNSISKPGFMQMSYRGSHDFWLNSFTGINSTQAQGFLKLNAGPLQVKAGGTFIVLNHYVYFKEAEPIPEVTPYQQRVLPYQSPGNQITLSPEIRASVQFMKHIYVRPQVIYNNFLQNDDNALKIPRVFVNTQLAYENLLFKSHLQVATGVEFHWHSSYEALGYDAVIQQFYVQDAIISPAFPLVDVYFTGKMRRGRFFFKYHNLVQAFSNSGYVPTPGYPGQRSLIDLGFDFLLFD